MIDFLDFVPENEKAAILNGTSTWDASVALEEAIASISVNGSATRVGGPVIELPYGKLRFNSTIQLKKTVILQGQGSGRVSAPSTILEFAPDTTGIIVHQHNTIDATKEIPATTGGASSLITRVYLKSLGGTLGHGIWFRATRPAVDDVSVIGFPQNGVNIVATSGGSDSAEGNANCFYLNKVRSTSNGGSGVFCDGADVNAGVGILLDCTSNGAWGIYDSSFLGNTWVACHAAGNTLGPYKTDNINARSLFLGCYSEGGQPPANIINPAMVMGGLHGAGIIGSGQTQTSGAANFQIVINTKQSRRLTINTGTAANEFMRFVGEDADHSGGWSIFWNEGSKCVEFRHARLTARVALQFAGDQSTFVDESGVGVPAGNIVLPRPMWTQIASGKFRRILHPLGGAAVSFNTADNRTYSAAELLKGTIIRDPNGAGRTDALPTAPLLVAAVTSTYGTAAVGDIIDCLIINGADAAETITIQEGTGGGWDANQMAASRVIPQSTSKLLRIRLTNVGLGTETYVAYL